MNKRREQPHSIVLLSISDNWCPEVRFTTQRTIMTDRRQPCEQRSSCEGNVSSSAWLSTSTAGDIYVHVCDSYPGGAHPGDYNQFPIVTLHYCVNVLWCQCHAKCN